MQPMTWSRAFASRVRYGRPVVTLKLAIHTGRANRDTSGESRWITGEPARRATHALRGRHDAVMVGVGTVMADDPELTCRIAWVSAQPRLCVSSPTVICARR